MKLSSSTTIDINGLSVTLSVQTDPASLRSLFSDSAPELSGEEFEGLFSRCLLEMPSALLQAHDSVSRSLLSASINLIEERNKI